MRCDHEGVLVWSRRVLPLICWSEAVNYDCSISRANYIHRIGCGGQFDHKGMAFNMVTAEDKKILQDIETSTTLSLKRYPLPPPHLRGCPAPWP